MSGKRPTDHLEPNAKRRSDRQLTKDDASDEDEEQVLGGPRGVPAAAERLSRLPAARSRAASCSRPLPLPPPAAAAGLPVLP